MLESGMLEPRALNLEPSNLEARDGDGVDVSETWDLEGGGGSFPLWWVPPLVLVVAPAGSV